MRSCHRIVSINWSPIVKTGLSDVIGSWKIIEIWLPRMRRISRRDFASRFSPSKRIWPPPMRPGGLGRSPRIDKAVTLLPQPELADQPQHLAGTQVERQIVDGRDRALLGGEHHAQIAH